MTHQYLKKLRSDSCYPTFRTVVALFTFAGFLFAAFVAYNSMGMFGRDRIFGLAGAVAVVILVQLGKETSFMLADIADAIIESSAKASLDPSNTAELGGR